MTEAILLYLHLASLLIALIGILWAEKAMLGWVRGSTDTVGRGGLFAAHWVVTAGIMGLVGSGLLLFWPERQYLLGEPLFLLKLLLVALLILNSFAVEYAMHMAVNRPFRALSRAQKTPLFISGGVSALCWLGALSCAIALFGFDIPGVVAISRFVG